MGLAAGKLRHRLVIERPRDDSDARDGLGHPIDTWPTVAPVWGLIEPLTSSEVFQEQQTKSVATHRITIRYRSDLLSKWRFRYDDPGTGKSRYFWIDGRPIDAGERRESLVCTVQEKSG